MDRPPDGLLLTRFPSTPPSPRPPDSPYFVDCCLDWDFCFRIWTVHLLRMCFLCLFVSFAGLQHKALSS